MFDTEVAAGTAARERWRSRRTSAPGEESGLLQRREQAWDEAEESPHWGVEFYRRRGVEMPLPPVGELRRTPNASIYGVPFAVGTPTT